MSSFQLTPSQQRAVEARGGAVLVSAAAGSGKTRVLVERLISYVTDPENPRDIDRFLVITYTNAAAAELRSRIAATLADMVAADPSNARLRRQQDLCGRAQIGTIHRFCTGLLRENCHLLGLAPDFRVAEEERAGALRQSAVEKLLDEAYGDIEKNRDFALLVDTVGAGRDDARLRATVLSLYSQMRSHPAPHRWAARQLDALSTAGVSDAGETVWGRELLDRAGASARYWIKMLRQTLNELDAAGEAGRPVRKAYGGSMEETLNSLEAFDRAAEGGWDAARAALPIAFPRVSGVRNPPDPELYERVKARRSACKKAAERLAESFNMDSAVLLSDIETVRPAMGALLALTARFDRAFVAAKRRQGLVDFGDLEHLALRLLAEGDDSSEPSAVARSLSERFAEVLVDEYQDVNGLQDRLISLISDGGNKLFMVGDVKQSIYRFRLADPGIFIGKYQATGNPESGIDKILLQENFRSRPGVLAAVNRVFEAIMSQELGEIPYDEEARLIAGADYPEEGGAPVTLTLLEAPEADEEGQTPRADQAEAEFVAGQIKALLDRGTPVWENGVSRPLRPGDVAILLRSPGPVGGLYKEALTRLGVPVQAEQGGSFFSSLEVSVTLSLLAVIDNPRQDVALISALRSPVFGFTPDELSLIRAGTPEGDFYAAVTAYRDRNPKCEAFVDLLHRLRDFASDGTVSELLRRLYVETDLPALCLAMAGGQVRRSNLTALYRCALRYEAGGGGSLFGFVSFLRRMMERGEEPAAAALAPENCVAITSIHRSKGLEYPVVFLAGTGRRFNKRDLIAPVLLHPRLGLGPMLTDPDLGLEYPTLPRQAVSQRLNAEGLSEEMRVLYVAMTRARERLYISGCFKKPEELVEKLSQTLTDPPDPTALAEASCCAHWLITAALLCEDGVLRLERAAASGKAPEGEEAALEIACGDPSDAARNEALAARMRWEYPHRAAADLPAKLTATELKTPDLAATSDPEAAPLRHRETAFRSPRPEKKEAPRPLAGAEAGTALHLVMQRIDLSGVSTAEAVAAEIKRLESAGHLDPEQARAVDPEAIAAFFRSDTGRRILSAATIHRELRFSLLADAEQFFGPQVRGEEILLQGVVDCCLENADELTIIDYKTDYVNQNTLQSRAEGYYSQLLAYAGAMERIFQKPVKACILYFLTAKEAVFVPLNAKR